MNLTTFQKMSHTERQTFIAKAIDVLLYNEDAKAEIEAIVDKYGNRAEIGTKEIVMDKQKVAE